MAGILWGEGVNNLLSSLTVKVLLNCLSSLSGGGQAYLRNVSALLADRFATGERQHRLSFLAYRDQAELLGGVPESDVIWIPGTHLGGFQRVVWERRNLPHIVAKHQFDVLFTPYQVAPNIPKVKNVLMIRNMEPFLFRNYSYSASTWLRNKALEAISMRSLGHSDRVIAVSQFATDYLSTLNIPWERIRTIYHGSPSLKVLDEAPWDRLSPLGISNNFILTSGSMLPYRRCEDVIRAFNSCLPALPDNLLLVIAGAGADAKYKKMIVELIAASPKPSRILMLGNVPWDTMMTLYRSCTLFVTATEIEACPNIALEAMAAGCAILSADRAPLPEIFNGCSLSYEPRDIRGLGNLIIHLLKSEDLRTDLRAKALLRSQDFSWILCAKRTYSALVDW